MGWTATDVHQDDLMPDPDRRWRGWLAALSDPRRELTITVLGTGRYPRWDMGRRLLADEHMVHLVRSGGHEGTVCATWAGED